MSQQGQVSQIVKLQTISAHNASSIPGLSSPIIPEKQTLPALNLPRKSLNLSLPQNYHAYKSQSESPFSMRNKSNTQKNYLNNNSIKLDKIEESQSGNLKNKIVHRQNRSISPSINEKQQIKNTLNISNLRNSNKHSRQQVTSEQSNKPAMLNHSQRLKMQTLQGDLKSITEKTQKIMSTTTKSNSQNTPSLQQQTGGNNGNQQKSQLFSNQRLQGSQVILVPKSQQQASTPSNQNENKQVVAKKPLPQLQQQPSTTAQNNNNNYSENNNAFKFYVGGGNNGERIRKLMLKREGWVETKDPTSMFVNFKWQQTTRGYKFEKLVENNNYRQVVNHFEFHKEITNKQYLIKNLMSFCEGMKQNVFDITPLTYVIDFNDENCDLILNNFLKFFEMNMPPQIKKKQSNLQNKAGDIRKILRSFQTQYGQQGTEKLFNYFYTRWSLQDTFLDKNNSSYMWILKPTFLNRGRGIHVFNSLQTLEKLMADYTEGFEEKTLKKQEKKEEDIEQQQDKSETIDVQQNNQISHESQSNHKKLSQSQPNISLEPQIRSSNQTTDDLNKDKNGKSNSQSMQKLPSPERQIDGDEEEKENEDKTNENNNNNNVNEKQQGDKENQPNYSPEVKKITQSGNSFQIKKIKPLQANRINGGGQVTSSQKSMTSSTTGTTTNNTTNSNSMVSSVPISNSNKQQKNKEKEKEKEKQDPNSYIRSVPTGPYILKASQFVVQKYIEKPLLINKRKFDIRVWALVTHNLDVYFFREGYMRLSSSEFSTDEKQLDNLFIHLTNNAIQKYSDNYGQYENGNMWSFQQLWEFLEVNYANAANQQQQSSNQNTTESENKPQKYFKKKIVSKIKDIIWLTFCSIKKKINQNERKHCFEVFGFDFLIDDELNSWLIEVNTNPAIDECSKLLKTLIPRALDDALKLTVDQIFTKRPVVVNNNNNNNNNNANNNNKNTKEKSPVLQSQKQNDQDNEKNNNQDKIIEGPVELEDEEQEEQEEEITEKKTVSNEQLDFQSPTQTKTNINNVDQSSPPATSNKINTDNNNNNPNQEPEYYPVPGYEDHVNMWELLGNLKDSSNVQVKKKFKQMK